MTNIVENDNLSGIDLSFLPEAPTGRTWGIDHSPRYSKSTFDLTLNNENTGRATFWCCIAFVDDLGEHHYVSDAENITSKILLDCANQTLRMLDLQY